MKIEGIRVLTLGVPIDPPVLTSFGEMTERISVLVALTVSNGSIGWGESWCNFPSWAPLERKATILEGLAPLLLGQDAREVAGLHHRMNGALRTLGRQWGAPGPVAQAISAVDIALWDLNAKELGRPLYRVLGGVASPIPVYASGLGPVDPHLRAKELVGQGVRAFKLKVGFGVDRDEENLALMREVIGKKGTLFVDANQAWDLITAKRMATVLQRYGVDWLEEPLAADDFRGMAELRSATGLRIAAGENIYGVSDFAAMVQAGAVDVLQPDVTKVGGVTECLRICGLAASSGIPYAPHFLGGCIGLLASAHLFASVPGGMIMELDANPNPLRTQVCSPAAAIHSGCLHLPDSPGLGLEMNEEHFKDFLIDDTVAC